MHTPITAVRSMLGAMVLALASQANAGLIIDLTNAVEGFTEDTKGVENDVLGNVEGYYGAQIYTDEEITTLTFEFVGSEAGWSSWLTATNGEDWETLVNKPRRKDQTSFDMTFDADGLVPFSFFIDSKRGGGPDAQVANGSNPLPDTMLDPEPALSGDEHDEHNCDVEHGSPNFWLGYEMEGDDIVAILIALDDGGAGIDDDHDDMVVRISGFDSIREITEVPVPAAGWLFLSALSLLGFKRRLS